jgi:hypothetical protein
VERYLHSPNTPSWRGVQLKRAQGQLYLILPVYAQASHEVSEIPFDLLFCMIMKHSLLLYEMTLQWILEALTPGVKRSERKADHSPPSSAKVKNGWSCTYTLTIRIHGVVLS